MTAPPVHGRYRPALLAELRVQVIEEIARGLANGDDIQHLQELARWALARGERIAVLAETCPPPSIERRQELAAGLVGTSYRARKAMASTARRSPGSRASPPSF